jgi:hypothetical protein
VAVSALDRGAVVFAALVTLAILVPPFAVLRALLGAGSDSPVLSLVVLAFFVSFLTGGAVAARRSPASPLRHSAAAAALAFSAVLVAAVARNVATGRPMGVPALVTAVVLAQIAVSLAVLGGLLGRRRRREPTP